MKIQNPKPEIRNKFEIQMTEIENLAPVWFGISDFEF